MWFLHYLKCLAWVDRFQFVFFSWFLWYIILPSQLDERSFLLHCAIWIYLSAIFGIIQWEKAFLIWYIILPSQIKMFHRDQVMITVCYCHLFGLLICIFDTNCVSLFILVNMINQLEGGDLYGFVVWSFV